MARPGFKRTNVERPKTGALTSEKVEEALNAGGSVLQGSIRLGIHFTTLYKWLESNDLRIESRFRLVKAEQPQERAG